MVKEPKKLQRGKAYHKKVQHDWEKTAEGIIDAEKTIKKPDGRSGRIDIHVEADNKLVAVVELKNSNWDRMTIEAVKRNVKRQAKQIWSYTDSRLSDGKEISPGIVFPKKPKDDKKLELIEELFAEQLISVVWDDESTAERKRRSQA